MLVRNTQRFLVVTDNGPQYKSDEFSKFLKKKGIKHTFSTPYYPATNSAAENFVESFKSNVLARL